MRNTRLLRRLRVFYRREYSGPRLLGGATWTEEHWGLLWFGSHRALWLTRKAHALVSKATWEVRFTMHGAWTITWDRSYET